MHVKCIRSKTSKNDSRVSEDLCELYLVSNKQSDMLFSIAVFKSCYIYIQVNIKIFDLLLNFRNNNILSMLRTISL